MRLGWSKGFTLIEIIIVILLASLLFGLASSAIIRSLERHNVNQVSEKLISAVSYSRALAIIKNKEQSITFYFNDNSYLVPEKNSRVVIPDTFKVKLITAESELDSENNSAKIRFFPDGSSTGGQITLESQHKQVSVKVDWLTGRAELEKKQHE